MKRPTSRQKAKAGLSLALTLVQEAEWRAAEHGKGLASAKRDLRLHRKTLQLAHEDARKCGVL